MATADRMMGSSSSDLWERRAALIGPKPIRLKGVLAAGTVLAKSSTTKERVAIPSVTTLYVLAKLTSVTGTVTVNGYPMLSDATMDDTVGTRKPIGLPTALSLTTTTAAEMSYAAKGEEFFEIECVVSGGVSDTATLAYIEVYGV